MPKRQYMNSDSRPESLDHQPYKRQKTPNGAPNGSRISSVAPLKSRIRDLKRALQHSEHMPADVRIEKERAIAGYRQDLEKAEREKQKQSMIKRYHMVRFFERQKAERHVKKAQKAVEASSPNQPNYQRLQQDLDAAKVDVCYAIYYPLTQKYVSLYTQKEEKDQSKGYETSIEKPEMWEIVRQSMAEGTLDALREGTSILLLNSGIKQRLPKASMPERDGKVGSSEGKLIKTKDMDEESDGGFFEESNER